MVRYEYSCPACGPWVAALAMGAAEPQRSCPTCGSASRRRWGAPSLRRTAPGLARQLLREEASRDVPEVVTAVPRAARRTAPADHRQARLPRP